MPRKRAYPLASHRIPLVRHRARSDLVLLKWLLNLLEIGKQPEVGRNFSCGGTKRGKRLQDINVYLARVGLGGDGVGKGKIEELGYAFVEGNDLAGRGECSMDHRVKHELTFW
jgi:hypothetical protein